MSDNQTGTPRTDRLIGLHLSALFQSTEPWLFAKEIQTAIEKIINSFREPMGELETELAEARAEVNKTWSDLTLERVGRERERVKHREELADLRRRCERGECGYIHEEDEGNWWYTNCGNILVLNDGTPADNCHKFCPYCGKTIKELEAGQ